MYYRQLKTIPFHNLWPEYNNSAEFIQDFDFTVWVTQARLGEFIQTIGQQPKEVGAINAQYCLQTSQQLNENFQRQFPPECQGRPTYTTTTFRFDPKDGQGWSNVEDIEDVERAAENIFEHEMPVTMQTHVSRELMISETQAQDMIFEYRRFIILEGMTNYKLYPSEPIDKVWQIHMSYSENYFHM